MKTPDEDPKWRKFILDEKGRPVVEPDHAKWQKWDDDHAGEFGWTDEFHTRNGRLLIQTIFLGYDEFEPTRERPLLWKTIVHRVGTDLKDDEITYTGGSAKDAERRHGIIRDRVRQRADDLKK